MRSITEFEIGYAGQQPGGVGVPEVVAPDVEVDPGGFHGGEPEAGAESVAEIGVPARVGNSRSSCPKPLTQMCSAILSSHAWRTPKVRGFVVLGVGLEQVALAGGGLLDERELRAVLGHELAHVYNRDILISSVAAGLASIIMWLAQLAWFLPIGRSDGEEANPIGALLICSSVRSRPA